MKKDKSKKTKKATELALSPILGDNTSSTIKEAYKITRTNIMFSLSNLEGCKTIVVASALPGEGKTTSCLNLATAFAQTGAKVLVIDADLRKPRVHKYVDKENDLGLANLLGGFCKLDELKNIKTELGFDCITSGTLPPNPAELLSSKMMEELLSYLSEHYDYIFIDSPPITIVTDALILSKYVTGVILVVRQKYTTHDLIKKALSSLEFAEAKVLGLVLNDAERLYNGYRYSKYGYKYKRYGYKYYSNYGYK